MHLRLQTFMFFLMFLSRLFNQKSIEMKRNSDRRRFVRMEIRQRAKRLRLCKFRKMMQRRRQLFMCLIMNFSTRTVNRHIWVKHRGTDLYRDLINNAHVFFAPSMRIWSFTLFNSIAIDLVRLHWTLDWCI